MSSLPFFITARQKSDLRKLGHSDEQIAQMTPCQAAELLNPLMRAALSYARRGWAVFPLLPGTKNPFPNTHAGLDATSDESQIVS